MNTLADIEAAVDALPPPQQQELLRHLAERVQKQRQAKRDLPLVAATGREITQQEIDDACDSQWKKCPAVRQFPRRCWMSMF